MVLFDNLCGYLFRRWLYEEVSGVLFIFVIKLNVYKIVKFICCWILVIEKKNRFIMVILNYLVVR